MNTDEFREQTVDEQIEALSRKAAEQPLNGRVIKDLRAFYADDARIIEHVWERLERHQAANRGQKPFQDSSLEPRWENDSPMETPVHTIRPAKKRSAFLGNTLIAAMIVIVLASSVVISELAGNKQNPANLAGKGNSSAGMYMVVVNDGIYRLSTTGKVIWHHRVNAPTDHVTPTPMPTRTPTSPSTVPTPTVAPVTPAPTPTPASSNAAFEPIAQPGLFLNRREPVVLNGTVFFTGYTVMPDNQYIPQTDYLVALDAATGRERWRKSMETSNVISNILASNGVLYIGTYISDDRYRDKGAFVYAFKPDGKLLWSSHESQSASISAVMHDVVYGSNSSGLYALNASNGKQRWFAPFPTVESVGSSEPMFFDGILYKVYYIDKDPDNVFGSLYAFDPSNGHEIWHVASINHSQIVNIVGIHHVIYIGDGRQNRLYAFDTKTKQIIWSQSAPLRSLPVVSGNMVIAVAQSNVIVAYDATTGAKRWSQGIQLSTSAVTSPILVAGDKLYYFDTHVIGALDARSGKKLWQAPTPNRNPNDFNISMTVVE